MKKVLYIFAVILLSTTLAFSTVDPGHVQNVASLNVTCPAMTFLCHGAVSYNLVAGDASATTCITQWDISNWDDHGSFTVTTPSGGIYTVTPPATGGSASDITVTSGSWQNPGLVSNGGSGKWKYNQTKPLCNATGNLIYTCTVKALAGASQGTYTVTFEQDFVAD